jgi:predicted small secreted protein
MERADMMRVKKSILFTMVVLLAGMVLAACAAQQAAGFGAGRSRPAANEASANQ